MSLYTERNTHVSSSMVCVCVRTGTGEKAGASCLPTEPSSSWTTTTTSGDTALGARPSWPSGTPGGNGVLHLLSPDLLTTLKHCFLSRWHRFVTSRLYKMGVAFMLAHPYGFTRVMSSFRWPRYFVNGKVSVGVVQHTFLSRKGRQLCSKFTWCYYIYYLFINSLSVSYCRPLLAM